MKWLMKSELDVYPWSQLVEDGSTHWDGVRNYQARNFMRDQMKVGDLILYYHSNCKPPHVAGVARVIKQGYPDHTSWDPDSKYFDSKSTPESPRWFMVDIEPVVATKPVPLDSMRQNPSLEGMPLLARGQRLSVQPVDDAYFYEICAMGGLNPDEI
ncbi:MAG: EVE domain-containing protein [Methanobacteriota archaeon]|nr:MAG: EVE domain-containing protein [Euryarchaeota archaeon]